MIDEGIYELVAAHASDLGLVGGLHPGVLPKLPTYPAATYQNVGSASWQTFETSGFQRERWQFDFYAGSSKAAGMLYGVFRAFFEGYQGVLPDGTPLQNVEHITRDGPRFDDASLNFRVTAEFYLYFTLP